MRFIIQNNSDAYVVIRINQEKCLRIEKLEQYVCDMITPSDIVDIAIISNYVSYVREDEYHLTINLNARCSVSDGSSISIDRKSQLFQNKISYEYFTVSSKDCHFSSLSHSVTNCDEVMNLFKESRKIKGSVIFRIFSSFVDSFIDTLYIGGVIGGILWIVFDYKVALFFLLGMYLFVTLGQLLIKRLHRSNVRFFNWAKDDFFEDDLPYFVKHINKFCK